MDRANEHPSRPGITVSCSVARCRALFIASTCGEFFPRRALPQSTDYTPKTIYPQLQLASRNPFGSDPARRLRLPAVVSNCVYYTAQWCCPQGCNRSAGAVYQREISKPLGDDATDLTLSPQKSPPLRYPPALIADSSGTQALAAHSVSPAYRNQLTTDPLSSSGVIPGLSFLHGSFPKVLRGAGWDDGLLRGDTQSSAEIGQINDGISEDVGREASTSVFDLRSVGVVETTPPMVGLRGIDAVETSTPTIGLHNIDAVETSPPAIGSRGVGTVRTSTPMIGLRGADAVGTSAPAIGLRGVGAAGTSPLTIGLHSVDTVDTSPTMTGSHGVNAFGNSSLTPPPIIGLRGVSAFGTSPLTPPSMIGLRGIDAVENSPPMIGLRGVNAFWTSPLTPPSMTDSRRVNTLGTSPLTPSPMTGSRGVSAFGTSPLTSAPVPNLRGIGVGGTPPPIIGLHNVNAVETSPLIIGLRDVDVFGTSTLTSAPVFDLRGVGAVETSTNLRDVGLARASAPVIGLQNADAFEISETRFNNNASDDPYRRRQSLTSAPELVENLGVGTNLQESIFTPPALLRRPTVSANDDNAFFESGEVVRAKTRISSADPFNDGDIFPGPKAVLNPESTIRFGTVPAAALNEVGSAARDAARGVILATAKWTQATYVGALLRLQGLEKGLDDREQSPEPLDRKDTVDEKAGLRVLIAADEVPDATLNVYYESTSRGATSSQGSASATGGLYSGYAPTDVNMSEPSQSGTGETSARGLREV